LEGSTSRNSGILSVGLRKSVGIFGESLGTCMLIGDLLVLHVLDIRSTEHSTCQIGVLSLKNLNIRPRFSVALVLLSGAEEYSFVPWRGLPSGILSFCLRKSVGFFFGKFGHLHARWRPFGVHVFDSSTSDLESVAEGCWRRFNSHCLIERWHHIVDE
jgi:hypothetical protein